jgi:hypothetical protein
LSKIIDQIGRTKVTADMLEKVVAAFAAMEPADRRDITARAVTIIRVLDEEGHLSRPDLATAIEFRLEALALLSNRSELKVWALPGEVPGLLHVQRVVFEAAATEPLLQKKNRPAFDPDSFFKRLTGLSDALGQA